MTQTPDFRKRGLIVPVYLPSFLITAAEGALLPIIPVTAIALGLDLASAGAVLSAMLLGALVAEYPSAWLNNRLGERRSMLVAAVLAALMAAVPFFGLGLGALVIAAALFGAAHALFGLARHSLLAHLVPLVQRARAMSMLGGMFRGGLAFGPVIASGVIATFGLDYAYLAASAMALLAAGSVAAHPAGRMQSPPSGQHGNSWQVAKANRHKLLTLGIASSIIASARTIRMIGLPLLAIAIGIDPATSAFIFGVTGFIDFALFYLAGIIMDKYGRFWASVPTLLTLGVLYLGAFLVVDLPSFWIFASISALANAASAGINMVLGADLAPEGARSEFLASFRFLTSGGVAFAPLAISGMTAVASLPVALAVTGLLNFYGAYLFWRYLPMYSTGIVKKSAQGD
jgi:MFS family permease